MQKIRYISFVTTLLFTLGICASECEQKQDAYCTLYQAANLQLMEEVQMVIYNGNWISYADVYGDGQLVMCESLGGIIDGNGFAISNILLDGSDINLVSSIYIVNLLRLKNASHLVLNSHSLYLLPTARLVADTGSWIHTRGAARIIRLSFFHHSSDVVRSHAVLQFFVNPATVCVTEKPVSTAFQHQGDVTKNLSTPFICPPSPPPKV